MAEIVGGARTRLIRDSVYHCIKDSLAALGWFDEGRYHQPINFLPKPLPNLEEIKINSMALYASDLAEYDVELGSTLVETSWTMYCDFYAESDALGMDVINDVRDILMGRMPSIDRRFPTITVYDYRQATPTEAFVVQIDDCMIDRGPEMPKPQDKFWYTCRFDVIDSYSGAVGG